MSNIIVFGQPLEQFQVTQRLVAFTKSSNEGTKPIKLIKKQAEPELVTSDVVTKEASNSEVDNIGERLSREVFYANKTTGVIGKKSNRQVDNPVDNYFELEIPENIDLSSYQVILNYDLYGVATANQTTKSINNNLAIGGQFVTINNQWSDVSEEIPSEYLRSGVNSLFFNRRESSSYEYKVKNLHIELVPKETDRELKITSANKYGDQLFFTGIKNQNISGFYVEGEYFEGRESYVEGSIKVEESLESIEVKAVRKDGSIYRYDYEEVKELDDLTLDFKNVATKNKFVELSYNQESYVFESISLRLKDKLENIESSVIPLSFKDIKTVSPELKNVTAGKHKAYRVNSNYTRDSLSEGIELRLRYDEGSIPSGYTAKDVKTFYFNKTRKKWLEVTRDSISYEDKEIISTVYNETETDFINGVIEVPESPETGSFSPTMMNEIDFANPSAGVVAIAPPKPNNLGSVSTSFPIKIPNGRNGMQPSLNVNYDSEAGNGWMGIGWNIGTPAISLNTKWGVPRFDEAIETEIYSLNGEDLVLKSGGDYTNPHRTEDITRASNRTFYSRKEGSFKKITRYGGSPSNYRWVVIDKSGNRSYYGGDATSVEENAVIRADDQEQNIAHWALYKSVDKNGNTILYEYDKEDVELHESVQGVSFYLDKIEYSEHNGNHYEVLFKRNEYSVGGTDFSQRPDIISSARKGVLEVTKDLLTEIEVRMRLNNTTSTIRKYTFEYDQLNFQKSQLTRVAEYDADGGLFYSNTIDYFDEVAGGNLIENSSTSWNGSSDNTVLEDMLSNLSIENSTLGTSASSGVSVGLRAGFGIGTNIKNINNTIGGSYNYTPTNLDTKVSLIDINGDGLPDKVFDYLGNVRYLPNLGVDENGDGVFGAEVDITNELNSLSSTNTKTNTFGGDIRMGVDGVFSVGIGKAWSTTRSNTDGYFMDFNGDGLPDYIKNGRIEFNKTSSWDDINFNQGAEETQNYVISGNVNEELIDDLDLETKDELVEAHSQFDHVKVWKAPYDGGYSISSQAKLVSTNNCDTSNDNNEFRFSIEKSYEGSIESATVLEEHTLSSSGSVNLNKNLDLAKGDMLFFRIHNLDYGCGGTVEWNPEIQYNPDPEEDNTNIPDEIDENNKNYRLFDAEEDFILNNGDSWKPNQDDTSIDIDWNLPSFNGVELSDDITLKIYKVTYFYTANGLVYDYDTMSCEKKFDAINNTYSTQGTCDEIALADVSGQQMTGGDKSYEFVFSVESDSNVEWDEIDWKPTIEGVQTEEESYPGVRYMIYDNNVNQSNFMIKALELPNPVINDDENTPFLTLDHTLFQTSYGEFIGDLDDSLFPLKINWVVKSNTNSTNELLHKRSFYMHKLDCDTFLGTTTCSYIFTVGPSENSTQIDLNDDDFDEYYKLVLDKQEVLDLKASSGKLYSMFFIDKESFGVNNNASINISLHENQDQGDYDFDQISLTRPFISKQNNFYGMSYRGWGQFLYNGGLKFTYDDQGEIDWDGPIKNYSTPIDMSVFDFDEDPETDLDLDDIDVNGDGTDIRILYYEQNNEESKYEIEGIYHTSGNKASYSLINGVPTSKLGRFGEPDIYNVWVDPEEILSGGDYFAFKLRSKSKGTSFSENAGAEISLSEDSDDAITLGASGTVSRARSKQLNEYVDINGDNYPDLVTGGSVQYTNMLGGLSEKVYDTRDNDFTSGATNFDTTFGASVGGLFPDSSETTNSSSKNPTNTNAKAGINDSNGDTYNSRQWMDINGDGLVDQVFLRPTGIGVKLNMGYDFSEEVTWGSYNIHSISERQNTSMSLGGGLGVGDESFNVSFSIGMGGARSSADVTASLIDVNGDGLPDLVTTNNVYLNNGVGFENSDYGLYNSSSYIISENESSTVNMFGTATFGFPIPLPFVSLKATFTPTASYSQSINLTKSVIRDVNGDGLPDFLEKDGNSLKAKLNRIGKTHLLKSVHTPLGGSWTVDYNREGNTYDLPSNKWVLNEVITYDGFTGDSQFGPDESLTTIAYQNPKHDRREREFLGFEEVRIEERNPDTEELFRYQVNTYHNENYYLKGAKKSTAQYDDGDQLLSLQESQYNLLSPETPSVNHSLPYGEFYVQNAVSDLLDQSRIFVAVSKTNQVEFESGNELSKEKFFVDYDGDGNLLEVEDVGDNIDDTYVAIITYEPSSSFNIDNITGMPKSIEIRDLDGQLLRKREAEYNTSGNLDRVITKLNQSDENRKLFQYDGSGNITSVHHLDSQDENGSHFIQDIYYDDDFGTYPVEVSDSFGHTSYTEYNYAFGIPTLSIDMNDKKMRTKIDNRGRVVEITGPNEMHLEEEHNTQAWTIRKEYNGNSVNFNAEPNSTLEGVYVANDSFESIAPGQSLPTNAQHFALTRHFDPAYADENNPETTTNHILTANIIDGFGESIQIQKSHFSNELKWLISGKEEKDAYGRVVKAYQTTTNSLNATTGDFTNITYDSSVSGFDPEEIAYDVKDRPVMVTQPGESDSMNISYSIDGGAFIQTTVNELNQEEQTYTDVRGRTTKTIQIGSDDIETNFDYNVVGELTKVTNTNNYQTIYEYDLAGRNTSIKHPDRGVQTMQYDKANNLVKTSNSLILAEGDMQTVNYHYTYNRLDSIAYPLNEQNNVKYLYGEPNTQKAESLNAVGRLVEQRDASGVQLFGYGHMGELTKNLRSTAVAGDRSYWFVTRWKYDSWNRVHEIVYPDHEVVNYQYNTAGNLQSITSNEVNSQEYDIVSDIRYTDYGEKATVSYGNGTKVSYAYDERRRMKNIRHLFNEQSIANDYKYDEISNVTRINTIDFETYYPDVGQLGGPVDYSFTYDDFNRLVIAKGKYLGPEDVHTEGEYVLHDYALRMTYDDAHNITNKSQHHEYGIASGLNEEIEEPQKNLATSYVLDYEYDISENPYGTGMYGYGQPHAPKTITQTPTDAEGCCDENDPRLKENKISYDQNGNQKEITQEVGEETISIRVNLWDEENRLKGVDTNPTAEEAMHPVANYTYDASGERIIKYFSEGFDVASNAHNMSNMEASRLRKIMIYPSGLLTARTDSKSNGELKYTKHYYNGSQRLASKIGQATDLGGLPTREIFSEFGIDLKPQPIRLFVEENENLNEAEETIAENYAEFELTPPSFSDTEEISLSSPAYGSSSFSYSNTDLEMFWFHPDHLGSSNYITNIVGVVSQHMEYLPFGETLVEEHLNSNNSPFRFNAKELDEETGNYYYGARYYDPKFSIWLSVDPLAELMPEWSSYAYTFNNPMNFTDPTGMAPEGGGSDDPPCCDDYVGDLSKVQQLDEVVVTAVRKNKKQREHMPAHMKKPLDWWNSDFEGNMNKYNATYGTDYKDDGTAYGYWQYDNYYEQDYNDQIRSIHSATAEMAEFLSYFLPMPTAGGAAFSFLIKRVPSSLKLAGRSIQLRRALTIRDPNALTKRSFGYTDKVSGSAFRQGRGPRIDYLTEKPVQNYMNYEKLDKFGRWSVFTIGSSSVIYYHYKELTKKQKK